MDKTTIDELRRLEAEATPGPWKFHAAPKADGQDFWIDHDPNPDGPEDEICVCERLNMPYYAKDPHGWNHNPPKLDAANLELIAAMRNALPALLAEREQMRERIAGLDEISRDYARELVAERDKNVTLQQRITELSAEVERLKVGIKVYSDELMRCFIHIAPEAAQDGPETMGMVIRKSITEREAEKWELKNNLEYARLTDTYAAMSVIENVAAKLGQDDPVLSEALEINLTALRNREQQLCKKLGLSVSGVGSGEEGD